MPSQYQQRSQKCFKTASGKNKRAGVQQVGEVVVGVDTISFKTASGKNKRAGLEESDYETVSCQFKFQNRKR